MRCAYYRMVTFAFLDPGLLTDGELTLVCTEQVPADPIKKWMPYYFFEIRRNDLRVGRVIFRIGLVDELYFPGHIGYVIDEAERGHRYAERGVRLLAPFIARHQPEAWISCAEENAASRKTIERLGAELVEIVDLPEWHDSYAHGTRRWCRYRYVVGSAHPE
ncbi:MAG: GNAT family N-acetyltransferase [Kofleriaceae bacterium]